MGAGIGMGMGLGMGQMFANMSRGMNQPQQARLRRSKADATAFTAERSFRRTRNSVLNAENRPRRKISARSAGQNCLQAVNSVPNAAQKSDNGGYKS